MSSAGVERARLPRNDDVRAHPAVAAVAVACAGVLLAGVAVSARGQAPEDVPTVLGRTAAGTTVQAPGEPPRVARKGARVPDGATVRTPADGVTVLRTGDRQVHLAGATHVTVLDGTRQALDAGSLLVDTDDGPRVRVAAAGADVRVLEASVVRLDRGAVLRVASYAGTPVLRSAGRSRRAGVAPLHQVQVPDGALPGRVTPLALTGGDRWERERIPRVVDADVQLSGLVTSLDDPELGARAAAFVPAAFRSVLTDADSSLGPGARAMTFAIAQASGDPAATYRQVLDGRELGGSWGVLSALVEADKADVLGFFDRQLPGVLAAVTQERAEADQAAAAAGGAAVLAGLLSPATAPDGVEPQPRRAPRPSSDPAPRPAPSPLPQDVPSQVPDELEEPAEATLREVVGLIPTALPGPLLVRPAPLPAAPLPPAPLPPAPSAGPGTPLPVGRLLPGPLPLPR